PVHAALAHRHAAGGAHRVAGDRQHAAVHGDLRRPAQALVVVPGAVVEAPLGRVHGGALELVAVDAGAPAQQGRGLRAVTGPGRGRRGGGRRDGRGGRGHRRRRGRDGRGGRGDGRRGGRDGRGRRGDRR